MINTIKDLVVSRAYAAVDAGNIFNSFNNGINTNGGAAGNAQTTLNTLVHNVFTWVLGISGFIAFIYLVIAGINYVTAGGDTAKANTARQAIIHAIIGIVVIVAAWFVVTFALGLGRNLTGGAI